MNTKAPADRSAEQCITTKFTHHDDEEEGGSRPISRVLSWATIPLGALLPVRSSSLPGSNASHAMRFPIWPCFGWGLPCRPCYHVRGGLLPHRFTLAVPGFPGLRRSTLCCTFRRLRLAAYSARPLAGIPLCEARTFLPAPRCAAVAWPTSRYALYVGGGDPAV